MQQSFLPPTTRPAPMSFDAWCAFSRAIRARADALVASRRDAAFALAASVGIPRNLCCLHNAAIDDDLRGWCKGNPARLRVAKRANWLLSNHVWEPSRLADRIISRAWDRIAR